MVILINVVADELERSIGWVSLQPDGSISVGLRDRTFVSPTFQARNFIWNFYNRVTLEYLITNSPETLRPVRNPHLTFHPPNYFHLRANDQEELFAGIAEPGLMLTQDERVPWIRFVSKPVRGIGPAQPPRNPSETTIKGFRVESSGCSIGLGIDFVRSSQSEVPGSLFSCCLDWHGHRIHVFCEELAAQISTLAWYHQC
jgi:hypothetical protein